MTRIATILSLALCGCSTPEPRVSRYGWPAFGIAPDSPLPALVVEVGNAAHCRDVWRWPDYQLGSCEPYTGLIRCRAERTDAAGRQVPMLETLGHEMWHLSGWGGQWHR